MSHAHRLALLVAFAIASCAAAFAQTATNDTAPPPAAPITVSVTAAGVRFAALGPVTRTRLEVFGPSGEQLFSTGFLPGNVRDWSPRDAQGRPLADGTYTCVVTAREAGGQVSTKEGALLVSGGQASLQLGGGGGVSQAGPAEQPAGGQPDQTAGAADAGDTGAMTVVAHDGRDGQVTSTSGALTFRTGDFFAGDDRERMRITPDGKVGVGTSDPQAALDVAGAVRATGGFRFSDGTTLDSTGGRLQLKSASGETIPGPSASGSGTAGQLAKWADNSGTLGDSAVTESGGNVGVGTTAPATRLHILSGGGETLRFQTTGNSQGPNSQIGVSPYGDAAGGALYLGPNFFLTPGGGISRYDTSSIGWGFGFDNRPSVDAYRMFRVAPDGTITTPFVVNGAGNVGIGAASPGVRLDVQGSVNTFNGVALALTNHNAGNTNTWALGAGGGGLVKDAFGIGDSSGYKMTFLANGNVGIGATNPLRTLQLGSSPDAAFTFSPSDSTPNAGYIRFGDHTGWKLHFARNRESSGGLLNTGTAGELMTIQDNGNVGVGNTAPTFRLHVVDTSNTGLRVQTNITGGTVASFGANGDFQIDAVNIPGGRLIVKENGNVGIGTANPALDPNRVGGSKTSRLTVKAAVNGCGYSCLSGQDGLSVVGGSKNDSSNARAGAGVIAIGGDASNGAVSGDGLVGIPGFADNATGSATGRAGIFVGELEVDGDFFVTGSKNFLIDHPLDPENKYLKHAAIESSEVLDAYSGNVVTDSNGEAVVRLPEWFEALNRDLRYQLTVVGQFAQAIVSSEVKDNRFTIKTSAPNVKVSWQVIGVRSDAYMRTHPFRVEEEKPAGERGTYLSPEAFGQPEEKGMMWARHPELMREMKERRERAQEGKAP